MALRVSEFDVGGQKVRFGNLQLRPQRLFQEALDEAGKAEPGKKSVLLQRAMQDLVLAAIQRADPGFGREKLEELDGDDLTDLFNAVTAWSGRGREKPEDPPKSP